MKKMRYLKEVKILLERTKQTFWSWKKNQWIKFKNVIENIYSIVDQMEEKINDVEDKNFEVSSSMENKE